MDLLHQGWEEDKGKKIDVITNKFLRFIKICLLEDESENLKKQRDMARIIYSRLVEELSFTDRKTTVRRGGGEIINLLKPLFH